ncbi:ABC transporter permease [Planococcus sp. ISL-109]|uniref:ABC transporter permease n=1 Tax=Planococcus sp. ISL-109 TaxID=2819166 RepID=UPI001BEA9EBE|nr:ABC transporter permease [Planococcus sp. ISL-109]MBT2581514.1 ABC transporter permease [Planococcus sp. ISL-109]
MSQLFDHTWSLMRFVLRRDRIRLPVWILSFILASVGAVVAFDNLYGDQAEREAIAETMENPAMIAMVGPNYGVDDYTTGAMTAHEMLVMTAAIVALMNILLVSRHSRGDEEEGRLELVRALPVGQLSSLSAVLLVLTGANVLLGVLTGVSMAALQAEGVGLHGSLLYGAALGATGLVFAGLTAVFAQLSQNARGTTGLSIAALLLFYMIRAIGDVVSEPLALSSPLGWILRAKPFVENTWWPVLLSVGVAVALSALALYLNAIRDHDSGFLPTRAGRTEASATLRGPFGLAWRLQRTGLIAWSVALFILGVSYGSVLGEIERFFEGIDIFQQMIVEQQGFSLIELFIPVLSSVMAILASIPAIMVMLKVKTEEKNGRLEHVVGRAVSRWRVTFSYWLLAVLTATVMLLLTGLGLGLLGNAMLEETIPLGTYVGASFVYLPAILFMIGVSLLFIGFLPSWASIVWLYLGFSFFVVYLGELLQLPDWVGKLTPYGHIPSIPLEEVDYGVLALLLGIAVILSVMGAAGFRSRDLKT